MKTLIRSVLVGLFLTAFAYFSPFHVKVDCKTGAYRALTLEMPAASPFILHAEGPMLPPNPWDPCGPEYIFQTCRTLVHYPCTNQYSCSTDWVTYYYCKVYSWYSDSELDGLGPGMCATCSSC